MAQGSAEKAENYRREPLGSGSGPEAGERLWAEPTARGFFAGSHGGCDGGDFGVFGGEIRFAPSRKTRFSGGLDSPGVERQAIKSRILLRQK